MIFFLHFTLEERLICVRCSFVVSVLLRARRGVDVARHQKKKSEQLSDCMWRHETEMKRR